MKNEKGISLITLILIIVIIIGVIIFIVATNQGKTMTNIEWGYMPSSEYYELRLAATTSEVSGAGSGTLSLASFNTLGKDVKNAGGKWFKNSNVNFKSFIIDDSSGEGVSLTDGEHVAIFILANGNNYVGYMFLDKNQVQKYNEMTGKNLLGGYKITIK